MGEAEQQQFPGPSGWRGGIITAPARWIFRHPFVTLCAAILGWIALQIGSLPFGDILLLRKKNPGETAFMTEQREQAREQGRMFRIRQHWIPLSNVPREAINAIVVAEDGSFWSNHGFDWFEFRASVQKDLEAGRAARGASTITQQLVKNLFLSSSKNPLRKLKEWALTWYMDQHLSKSRILELYVNVIEWGEGIYGIDSAARYYFDKSASSLTPEECLRLAAIIPSPRRHRADGDSRYVLRRSKIIQVRMVARGMWKDTVPAEQGDSTQGGKIDSAIEMPEDTDLEMPGDSGDETQ